MTQLLFERVERSRNIVFAMEFGVVEVVLGVGVEDGLARGLFAVQPDDGTVVHPVLAEWTESTQPDGEALPEDFVYRSDTNDQWLSVEELREMIATP